MDNITFYSDREIQAWVQEFTSDPASPLFIKGCPFSWYEVRAESMRRERCQIEPMDGYD